MRTPFGAKVIARKSLKVLARQLARQGLRNVEDTAVALKQLATQAIPAQEDVVKSSSRILEIELNLYQALSTSINQLDCESGRILAQLPEALLTSIKGIGITLAANICAETGPLVNADCDALNAYGGVVPRVKQTGGPESEAHIGGNRQQFNRILKDYLLQAGNHLYLHGPDELREDALRRKSVGKAVETAMARRFLRTARALCRSRYVYLPSPLRSGQEDAHQERRAYLASTWPHLLVKWKRLGLHQETFDPNNPLGQWREVVQDFYDLSLNLE